MTHAEQILRAAGSLTREGRRVFTREEVRQRIGVDREDWDASHTAIFQAMREDEPGGAPPVGERWRGVFRRVAHGEYVLTERGRQAIHELLAADARSTAWRAGHRPGGAGSVAPGTGLPAGVSIRPFADPDLAAIQRLLAAEGWPTPATRPADALAAWRHSRPALVAVAGDEVIGFLRALSDGAVTTYICELLVTPAWRGQGVGRALLEACHHQAPDTRLDLLSGGAADAFYEAQGFRPFRGYRKSYR